MEDYHGSRYKILHCKGAKESFDEALKKHKSMRTRYKARMRSLIERLGKGEPLSSSSFPREGSLPDGSRFRALKKIPIRAYLWLSKKHPDTYYISHYIYKDFQKLKDSDTRRVCDNWEIIEQGDKNDEVS
ncbi:hypothetical protein [Endozoicomonas arenosclerae]|uniref:hypothetical protein n=1 Tax=Endozoicomonas arenosclerae TaxID=1633495 RepID=UPI000785E628|nr:hypothetical protein [Endozoicomonas arenosclerae]